MRSDDAQDQVYPAGPLERLRDIVDRSIAMFIFRRLTGRPTEVADRRPFPPALTVDEVAYRIGAPGATSRPIVYPVAIAPEQPSVARADPQAIRPPARTGSRARRRLIRDSVLTLAGFAAVAVVAVVVWPPARGSVLGATATPGPYLAVAPPFESAATVGQEAPVAPVAAPPETPVESPTSTPTPIPSGMPPPHPTAAGGSTFVDTMREVLERHRVQRGETLSGIARERGVTLAALLAVNPQIADPNRIRTGDLVTVPRGPGA